MDNNQNQTTQPTQPITPPTTPVVQPKTTNTNKTNTLLLVLLFAITIAGATGIFLFMNKKLSSPTLPAVSQDTPTPTPFNNQTPEESLEQVTIEDPTEDMRDINLDVSQL